MRHICLFFSIVEEQFVEIAADRQKRRAHGGMLCVEGIEEHAAVIIVIQFQIKFLFEQFFVFCHFSVEKEIFGIEQHNEVLHRDGKIIGVIFENAKARFVRLACTDER